MIMKQVSRRLVLRKRIAKLLCRPGRGRMLGDRDVYDPATVVREDHEDKEQPEGRRGHDEEIGGQDLARWSGTCATSATVAVSACA